MSPLPERRKTAEELAELRQSLGIPKEAPCVDSNSTESPSEVSPPAKPIDDDSRFAPAVKDSADAHHEDEATSEAEEPPEPQIHSAEEVIRVEADRPVRSLRKSGGLPVDRPKQQIARGDSEVIPSRRHSDEELNRLRKAAQLAPPVGDLLPKAAHLGALLLLYGLGSVIVFAAVLGAICQKVPLSDLPFDWLVRANQLESFGMILFGICCGGALVFLAGAGWLAWARPLSRHHAGFMTIIAVLVLVFGTLYFFPEFHAA